MTTRLTGTSQPLDQRSIVLIGMMGSGKSSVGGLLAHELGLSFRDLDQLLEVSVGMTISELVAAKGMAEFRRREREIFHAQVEQSLLSGTRYVFGAGGGLIVGDENRRLMRDRCISVWLDAPIAELVIRLDGATDRPLIARDSKTTSNDPQSDDDRRAELRATLTGIFKKREQYYSMADIRVQTSGMTPMEICQQVRDRITGALVASPSETSRDA